MPETKSHKTFLILAGALAVALAVVIFWQVSLNVGIRPTDSEQIILLFVLSTLVSLTFLIFGFILTRSMVKLYIERRANQLGSKFKTKLVIGALALSLLPVIFLFYSSYVLTNRTLQRWFTQPFESVTRQTREIVEQISRYAAEETAANAAAIAQGPLGEALRAGNPERARQLLGEQAVRQGVNFLAVEFPDGSSVRFPPSERDLLRDLSPEELRARQSRRRVVHTRGADYAVAVFPLDTPGGPHPAGWIIAANRLPAELTSKLVEMNREQETYNRLHREGRVLRNIYMAILALVTVLILFIATWVALFLSKQVTVPIQALAEATHQVSLGNLSHRINVRAIDELGVLVRSFNDMTAQIAESRAELERRRRETEAILESIPTAVISLSRDRRVLRINPAVERMFGPERARSATLRDLLDPEDLRAMEHLLRRALRQGLATGQFELNTASGKLNVAVTVSALRGPRDAGAVAAQGPRHAGAGAGKAKALALDGAGLDVAGSDNAYIVVMEDISDLLHAQQAQAWREVAQRVAHEIRNPLTPIALSAERIRLHLERLGAQEGQERARAGQTSAERWPAVVAAKGASPGPGQPGPAPRAGASLDVAADQRPSAGSGRESDREAWQVITDCSALISQEVGTLKSLVDEFSQLAGFPQAHLVPANLNDIVQAAVAVFDGRLDSIRVDLDLTSDLPPMRLDPDQIKRVIVNLVDNAAESMERSLLKELHISTALDPRGEIAELVVADTGGGVSAELKEKLFLPYFSTKKRGTGLGLAIASRIVAEHGGSIRVEENQPVGARFIVELPVPGSA